MASSLAALMLTTIFVGDGYQTGLAAVRAARWEDAHAALLTVDEHEPARCKALYLLTIAAAHLGNVDETRTYGDQAWACKPLLEQPFLGGLQKLRNWAYGVNQGVVATSGKFEMSRPETTTDVDLQRAQLQRANGIDPAEVQRYSSETIILNGAASGSLLLPIANPKATTYPPIPEVAIPSGS